VADSLPATELVSLLVGV